jgi:cytochrome bd-type quinol oxidase subunit 1
VAAEGLLAFFAQADFFGIFLWERKIDFANNKCNFSSTRNTFWCQAHSAVSLPPAKD